MTSKKLSSKSFLGHRICSHWYLSLISAILLFLSGPFVLLISFNKSKNYYTPTSTNLSLNDELLRVATDFFEKSNSAFMYILAYALATIIGLVLFSYLNNKKQINFYHSQPLSRKKLFVSNYFAAMLLGVIPLIVMFLVAVIVAISTVGVGSYISTLPMHILSLTVFYITGLSITVLACQLTGSTIFAMYVIGFLNFFVPAIFFLGSQLISELSATMYISTGFISYLSPVTYFIFNIVGYGAAFSISQICAYLLFTIIVTIFAHMLYLIRPSEATGKTIIYKPIGGLIKYVSSFGLATVLGFVFADTGGGFSVFVIIFGGFFLIACLFMEVAFRRSFKNMKTILPSTILATIIAVGGLYGLSAFSQNLDTKVPEASKVKIMTFDFVSQYINQYGNENINMGQIDDPELIKEAISVINKVVAESNYNLNAHGLSGNNTAVDLSDIRSTNINVIYNNSPIKRTYYNVNVELLMDELSSIYENPKYKDLLLSPIENAIAGGWSLSWFGLDANMIDGSVLRYNYDSPKSLGDFAQDDKYVQPLVAAILKDINESKYSDFVHNADFYGTLTLSYQYFDNINNYIHLNVELFENYVNIKKVIATMMADPEYSQFISLNNS